MEFSSQQDLLQRIDELQIFLLRVAQQNSVSGWQDRPSDLVQQTLADALAHAHQCRASSLAQLKAWLRKILLNNALLAIRLRRGKDGANREISLDRAPANARQWWISGDDPAGPVAEQERLQLLLNGLQRLPTKAQAVLQLRYHQQLPFAEIAVRVHSTEEAVRKVHARSLAILRQEFNSLELHDV